MSPWLGPYLVACVLLAAAGSAKAFRPDGTARAVGTLFPRLPHRVARMGVRVAALTEAVLGTAALALPSRPWAATVALSYGAFTAFTLYVLLRKGVLATCGCFGEPDTPATRLHVALTFALAVSAGTLAWTAPTRSLRATMHAQTTDAIVLCSAVGVTAYLAFLVLTHLARLETTRGRLRADAHLSPHTPRPGERPSAGPIAFTATRVRGADAAEPTADPRATRLG